MSPVSHNDFTAWKQFHIGDILTVTTGVMVTPNGIGGIYKILDWMTDEQLFTHQLPRASKQCEPILKDLYPGLVEVKIPDATNVPEEMQAEFWQKWLAEQVLRFGEQLPVPKLINHTAVNPISELQEMIEKNGSSTKIILPDPESLDSEAKYILERLADGS